MAKSTGIRVYLLTTFVHTKTVIVKIIENLSHLIYIKF